MRLRIASDIHTEFFGADEIAAQSLFILPPMLGDKETTLILAGDIGAMGDQESLVNFMREISPRFDEIFYIPGNHEYYHGDIITTPDKIEELVAPYDNVFFTTSGGAGLRNGKDIHLHTLWTDFDGGNEMSMLLAERSMNDYRLIRNGDQLFTAKMAYDLHKQHIAILEEQIKPGDIVVTHHSPCLLSVPEDYKGDRINGAYHSDLSDLILRKKPSLWFHGHTHTACRYKIGDTEIICNPRGYGRQHKTNGYNPVLMVEV